MAVYLSHNQETYDLLFKSSLVNVARSMQQKERYPVAKNITVPLLVDGNSNLPTWRLCGSTSSRKGAEMNFTHCGVRSQWDSAKNSWLDSEAQKNHGDTEVQENLIAIKPEGNYTGTSLGQKQTETAIVLNEQVH